MKNFLFLFLLLSLIFVFFQPAIAQEMTATITLSWDADLTVIEPDVQSYNIYSRLGYEEEWALHDSVFLDRNSTTGKMTSDVPLQIPQGYEGDLCFYVTAVDTSQNESGPSEVICKRYDKAPPAPPTGLSVEIKIIEVPIQ